MKKIFFLSFMFFKVLIVQAQQKTIVSSTGEKVQVNTEATTTTTGIIRLAGDLSGTATDPVVGNLKITAAKIADGAITDAKITGPISIAKGGTGATTAAGALTNLGAQSTANLSTDFVADATSVTKYPSIKTVKDYVDAKGGGGIYGGSGALTGNTVVAQGTNTLAFTSNSVNGFSVDGTTFSVDALNNNVGIGTINTAVGKLVVESPGDAQLALIKTAQGTGWLGIAGVNSDYPNFGFVLASDGPDIIFKTGSVGGLASSGSERLRIANGTGNIGINNNFPTAGSVHIKDNASNFRKPQIAFESVGTGTGWVGVNTNELTLATDGGDLVFKTNSIFPNGIDTGNERMRITNTGQILMNTAVPSIKTVMSIDIPSISEYSAITINNKFNSSLGVYVNKIVNYSGVVVGSIFTNNNSTSFNSASDYRLKEDLKSFNALNLINQIPVYDFAWKSDKSRMYGVMAHELQAVVPYSVTGEKDAVNADGTIAVQQVDYTKLVPLAIKAIQEQGVKIEALQNKNIVLEQRVGDLEKSILELKQLLIKN